MQVFIIFVGILLVALLAANWNVIVAKINGPRHPQQTLHKGEFTLYKPAGFYEENDSFACSLYSVNKAGAIVIQDGQQIAEEFNCAWAVVSVTPGNTLEICRDVAKSHADTVISESDSMLDGETPMLMITRQRKTQTYMVVETTHKVLVNRERNKTYELRVSVLKSKQEHTDETFLEYSIALN